MYRKATIQVGQGREIVCHSPQELAIHVGDHCVLRAGVLEHGQITHLEEVDGTPPEADKQAVVLRRATLQDKSRASENAVMSKMAQDACIKRMAELKLEMHLIHVRYSFDRVVLSIAFMAEWAVDFRELVKRLESELKTRVEMKQIGVRDTAKMIGGFGPCGQHVCCSRWLESFDTVSIKMAKVQRMSLNPNTISGMCGRLKCCLRFEHECYREMSHGLPRDGAEVRCPGGTGIVAETSILKQRVKVRMSDNRMAEFDAREVAPAKGGKPEREVQDEDPGAERP